MYVQHKPWLGWIFSGLPLLSLALILAACQAAVRQIKSPVPKDTPTPSAPLPSSPAPSAPVTLAARLAQPPLPAHPTQLEQGRYLYWLNCMPCHGDKGQGLTDEFRALYVEDADCWARGCHGGRTGDQGFPIPHMVPAIISSTGTLPPFATPQQLFEFLRATHPPQHPGLLPDDQYWAITAYLLDQNGRLPAGQVLGPQK